jgi:hypothetical protein
MSKQLDLADLFGRITDEVAHSNKKHGSKSIAQLPGDSTRWLAILGEEFGEVCEALTYDTVHDKSWLIDELIQVAAVATCWAGALFREETF